MVQHPTGNPLGKNPPADSYGGLQWDGVTFHIPFLMLFGMYKCNSALTYKQYFAMQSLVAPDMGQQDCALQTI